MTKFQTIATLSVGILIFSTSQFWAQPVKFTTRTMTAGEFQRLMDSEGVYQPGKNYNQKIDGHGTGLRPPTLEEWEWLRNMPIYMESTRADISPPPASHDNSATIWFPPIGNQDGEGTCVSWATGYYTKTFQEAKEHNWDLSSCLWENGYYGNPSPAYQDKIFSPDFIYHQVNDGRDNGSYYSDNMNLLERIGCCTWDNLPYNPKDTTSFPGENAWRQAPWYRSQTGYGYFYVDTNELLDDLKNLLASGNLAIISINANYFSSLNGNDLWTLDNYNTSDRNHATTIVGYDNNFGPFIEAGNTETYGAFKVANSWGVGGSWENVADGFYYVSYQCMKQRVGYVFFYENRIDYTPEIIALFQLEHEKRGECNTTFGIGDPASPAATKRFDDYNWKGGDWSFPANNMILDITEFKPYMSGSIDTFFIQIYDDSTATTGTIGSFSVEIYDDYTSENPAEKYVSNDVPVNTVNLATSDAKLTNQDNSIPVELALFTASINGQGIELVWRTETEKNNYGFHIYRSHTGMDSYEQINPAIISGAGTSGQAHYYRYLDHTIQPRKVYYYKLADVDYSGKLTFHGPVMVQSDHVMTNYSLEQNYPNPFNPETAIKFSIKEAGKVCLKIYNMQGQLIRSLVDEDKLSGSYSIIWNGTNDQGIRVSSGTYLYTLKVNGFEDTKKLTFMK